MWFLIHSDAAMSGLKSNRVRVNPDAGIAIYRDECTAFGHEVRDEIDWWINRKETNQSAVLLRVMTGFVVLLE